MKHDMARLSQVFPQDTLVNKRYSTFKREQKLAPSFLCLCVPRVSFATGTSPDGPSPQDCHLLPLRASLPKGKSHTRGACVMQNERGVRSEASLPKGYVSVGLERYRNSLNCNKYSLKYPTLNRYGKDSSAVPQNDTRTKSLSFCRQHDFAALS